MTKIQVLTLFLQISLLTACGFTLRGTAELPLQLQTLQLQFIDGNTDIVREMRRALINSGVTLQDETEQGIYQLGIGREVSEERILSVNVNARAGEYQLSLSVPFQLRISDAFLIEPENITIEKVYLADPNNAVAKAEEAEQIKDEIRRELVNQILRRLQTVNL
jgi:LPS-assembly lipoprotein